MNKSNIKRAVVDPIQGHVSEDEALRLSEQRYRSLVLASASTVWVTDANGGFCSPQDSWEAYTGQPWNEHRGWGWSKMLHPEDADRMTAAWRAAVNDPGLFFLEGRVWNAELVEYHYCEVRGAPILNADDTIREWVGTTTDVHDRQIQLRDKTNRAIRESESRLAEAQRMAKIGSFQSDPVSGVVTWSRELFRILGYDPHTTTPSFELFLDRVHPDDRARVVAVNERLSDGKPVKYQFRLLMPDGSCKHIRDHIEFVFDASGRPIRLLGTAQDITEHKEAEDALRASETRYADLYDNAPDMFCSIDAATVAIVRCNQTLADNLGYTKNELLGRSLLDIYHSSSHAQVHSALELFRETGDVRDLELQLRRRDGSAVDVSLSVSAIRDAQGKITHSRSIWRDITQRKQAEGELRRREEQLRQLNVGLEKRVSERTAELEDKNAELEAFGHSVSHDLRAPLRGMEGFALALAEDYADRLDEEGREYIQHIIDSARRMDALINDLLAYSRISRDQLPLKPVALWEAVTSSLQDLEDEICLRDAEVNIAGDLPIVLGHAATIGQIVTNLVSNAIKFTAAGVRPRVRLSAECGNNTARFWVEDNGIGIAPKYHQRIFNVFERLHGIETYPGTGIGLAIVSRASRRLNGLCGVESSAGQGSRFWVELPLRCGGH